MKQIIFVFFIFFLIIPVATGARHNQEIINKKHIKSKLKEHIGVLQEVKNGIIIVYELEYKRNIKYKLDKKFLLILNSKDMPYDSRAPIKGNIKLLKTGYKIKFLLEQRNKKIKKIYIEEMPK